MANDNSTDPNLQFQEWITQWERSVDEFSNKIMGTDEFSRSMNQMQGLQLEFQKRFGEMMARQLASLNMPSRDDIIRVSEDLRNLDRRMAHVERHLEKLVADGAGSKSPRKKSPARTKKAPSTEG
jgi:BMFP domain-containing protein YqiC